MIFFILALFTFTPADAGMVFSSKLPKVYLPGISDTDEFTQMLKKHKKKKKKGSKQGPEIKKTIGASFFWGLPLGDFGNIIKSGTGVNVKAEYFVTPILSLGINAAYYSFSYDKKKSCEGSTNIIPVLAEARVCFSKGYFRPFAGIGLGMFNINTDYISKSVLTIKDPLTQNEINIYPEITNKQNVTKPGIAPTAGFIWSINDHLNLHFSINYDVIFTAETKDGVKYKNTSFMGFNPGVLYSF